MKEAPTHDHLKSLQKSVYMLRKMLETVLGQKVKADPPVEAPGQWVCHRCDGHACDRCDEHGDRVKEEHGSEMVMYCCWICKDFANAAVPLDESRFVCSPCKEETEN